MPRLGNDLWSLVSGRPEIDPNDLAHAVEEQAAESDLDYRTRLLVRDSVAALRAYWGEARVREWLHDSPAREAVEEICGEEFERPGFPSIRRRLMEKTDPEDIRQFLRQLGTRLNHPVRCVIGGSASLMLKGYLSRKTDDIDVVDEVPAEIRSQHSLLDELEQNYGLHIAHFQSHYLPSGWQHRTHSLEPFGRLQASVVDVYDVALSKLFSRRTKDMNDLRMVLPQLDKETLVRRLKDTAAPLRATPELAERAKENWYVLFGEELPQ
jgi:hypothetical protein